MADITLAIGSHVDYDDNTYFADNYLADSTAISVSTGGSSDYTSSDYVTDSEPYVISNAIEYLDGGYVTGGYISPQQYSIVAIPSISISGNQVTIGTNSLRIPGQVPITGVSFSGTVGNIVTAQAISIGITGTSVTFSTGVSGVNFAIGLSGNTIQAITTSSPEYIDGGYVLGGYLTQTSILPEFSFTLSGVNTVLQTGNIFATQTVALTGNQVSVSSGILYPTVPVSGNQVSTSSGTVGLNYSFSLTGNAVTSNPGNISASFELGLTGNTVVVSVGNEFASIPLTGNVVNTTAGSVTSKTTYQLNSNQITINPGNISTSQVVSISLSGNNVGFNTGIVNPAAPLDVILGLVGLEVSAQLADTANYTNIYTIPTVLDTTYPTAATMLGVDILQDIPHTGSYVIT